MSTYKETGTNGTGKSDQLDMTRKQVTLCLLDVDMVVVANIDIATRGRVVNLWVWESLRERHVMGVLGTSSVAKL